MVGAMTDPLKVVSLESRRSDDMARMLERYGFTAIAAPSMREVPLDDQVEALAFGDVLLAGQCDVLVLLTGVAERLHRADFGAGLGTALFEPLDGALTSLIEVRAQDSLDRALGDRVEVMDVTVGISGESDIDASVTYRLRPAGPPLRTEVRTSV